VDREPVTIRAYTPEDRAACLVVFESNVGTSFVESERGEFERFLDELPGPYYVMEDGGRVVACGGFAGSPESTTADLCWGMVMHDRQRAGLGRSLTQHRIDEVRKQGVFTDVMLRTSHDTEKFYERLGFTTEKVVPNGIAEGLHRHEMRLHVRDRPEK
jgi:N-acetylglutamate synthase-like GNAT family acetyltransferase